MSARSLAGRLVAPVALKAAPGLTASFVRQAFDRAVDGVGPMRGAAEAAERRLAEYDGDAERAISALVDSHVRLAGAQGFLTNIGGLVTMTLTVPANISGLALLQAHLVAAIAHLRGYDLADPRVRNAVLTCMLGEDGVRQLIKKNKLPSSPMAIATAPSHDATLDERISTAVATELVMRVAGKRTMSIVGRRMPIIGGGVGAVTDGLSTYQVGRYAAKELKSRRA